MRRIFFLLALGMSASLGGFAQSDVDVLRFSMQNPSGTARYIGAGGAFSALGGDFGALTVNPASIGVYRSSELVLTPGLYFNNTQAGYFGNSMDNTKYNFNLSNFGIVFNKLYTDSENKVRTDGWVALNFGFGMNRVANYHSEHSFSGYNLNNSFTEQFAEEAAGTSPSMVFNNFPFGAGLAYETYLIDPMATDTMSYVSKIMNGQVQQTRNFISKGSMNEYSFSLGANYSNKVFAGASINIPSVTYTSQSTFTEEDINDSIADFASFNWFDYVHTSGTGINVKAGVIWSITEMFRLGASIHSPTYISLSDRFYSEVSSDVETVGTFSSRSKEGFYDYAMITPWKVGAGASVVFPKRGFISVDYEYQDFSQGELKVNRAQDKPFENNVNTAVDQKYTGVHTVRVGAEAVIDIFRIRGGYMMAGSPFEESVRSAEGDLSHTGFSVGAGIRGNKYFIDLAYQSVSSNELYVPYVLNDPAEPIEPATLDKTNNQVLMTVGFRF